MAYLAIAASRFIPNGNYITVNGSDPVYVQNGFYKIPSGSYTVVVHSANGQAWSGEGNVYDSMTHSACMSIRLMQDNDGNITDMEYAVYNMNSAQESGAMFVAKKLKLQYSRKTESVSENSVGNEALQEDIEQPEVIAEPDMGPDGPVQEFTQVKKGGTGWIIFGVVCLLAAFATAETIQSVIACGVLGVICLFVGIKKKKS